VLFLRKIKECVEDPKNILFDIWLAKYWRLIFIFHYSIYL
jgi:hypothetical protein